MLFSHYFSCSLFISFLLSSFLISLLPLFIISPPFLLIFFSPSFFSSLLHSLSPRKLFPYFSSCPFLCLFLSPSLSSVFFISHFLSTHFHLFDARILSSFLFHSCLFLLISPLWFTTMILFSLFLFSSHFSSLLFSNYSSLPLLFLLISPSPFTSKALSSLCLLVPFLLISLLISPCLSSRYIFYSFLFFAPDFSTHFYLFNAVLLISPIFSAHFSSFPL